MEVIFPGFPHHRELPELIRVKVLVIVVGVNEKASEVGTTNNYENGPGGKRLFFVESFQNQPGSNL